jgi:hypothetical protein
VAAFSEAAKARFLTIAQEQEDLPAAAPAEASTLVWDDANQDYTTAEALEESNQVQDYVRVAPEGFVFKDGALVPDDGSSTAYTITDNLNRATAQINADASSKFITFDDVTAPCFFADTTRLTDQYAGLGVIFEGPGGNDGGAILNECGGFNVTGHSSPNFLAFNTGLSLSDGGIPKGPETIYFNTTVSEVQAIVGSSSSAGQTLTMAAYDAESVLVDSVDVVLAAQMKPINVAGEGIVKVVILTAAAVFVLDDLTWGQWCPVTYDVLFGTVNPPTSKICSNYQTSFCDPGNLIENKKYFWRVVTKSPGGNNAGPVWNFTTGKFCECDLNNSGNCNILDYQIFIQDWGKTNCNAAGVVCECDLNLDGSCNILDYQLFIQNWGQSGCSAPEGRCKPQTCGNYTFDCNPSNPSCVCYKTAEGYGSCGTDQSCSGLQSCNSSSECPVGYICAVETCCGTEGVCLPDNDCLAGQFDGSKVFGEGPTTTGK